jgi:hypothetical protein
MSTVPHDVTPEDQSDQNAILKSKLQAFLTQVGRTAAYITCYGIISIVVGSVCSVSQKPLIFGGTVPFLISGIVLIWIGFRLWKIRSVVKAQTNDGSNSSVSLVSYSKMITKVISRLRHLRSVATLIFGIGILILLISCVISWAESITGLSLAMVIQFGLISVFAMMITFWLEIHLNELERHMQ